MDAGCVGEPVGDGGAEEAVSSLFALSMSAARCFTSDLCLVGVGGVGVAGLVAALAARLLRELPIFSREQRVCRPRAAGGVWINAEAGSHPAWQGTQKREDADKAPHNDEVVPEKVEKPWLTTTATRLFERLRGS